MLAETCYSKLYTRKLRKYLQFLLTFGASCSVLELTSYIGAVFHSCVWVVSLNATSGAHVYLCAGKSPATGRFPTWGAPTKFL